MAAVASAISNVKAQSVNWYTKYRSRWKKCKARVAGREKANTNARPPVDNKRSLSDEKMTTTTDTITSTTTSSSSLATMESVPSIPTDNLVTSEKANEHAHVSATGLTTRDPEILALLDKYSSELVAMVKQKLQ